ncbi:DUF2637 domain-containing protein [Streptomyces sp. NBC_01795]|uniref:DUF2637 domain-containing protein n=1 Tax=Streptomyces sp. NBC_01795 TaxID=2975943 RepID=UPI002DD8FB6F|nr:DUF2637 domain-containing protein [Streptomyces sp. NBC_01795]WSA94148.1 DUF2637 domain-containing protein [Streptomyces sp. NBC_01795]
MRAYLARVDAVLVQAVIAAALSFAHLHDLASAAGQDGWKAWAYPVSVDLLLVAAWRRLRTGRDRAAGWCWFLVALTASLGANIATAGLLDLGDVPDWLRILVAGWPALAFLGGTLLAHSPEQPSPTVRDGPEPVPAVEHSAPQPEPEPTQGTPWAPELPPSDTPVPAALVEHARKIADAHQARTGNPLDTPTLRARLSVPAPLAEQIAAQLT